MAVDILVKYHGFPALEIGLDSHRFVQDYKELVRKNSQKPAISRDPCRYNKEHFSLLVQQARLVLGWDWVDENLDLATSTRMHKDIEKYLAGGFHNVSDRHDELLHELHYGLHAIEGGNHRGNYIQVEWFNDECIPIAEDFEFCLALEFGDVKLQNPYVGHDPIFVYNQQDSVKIAQTCKFHDVARPGINIMIVEHDFPFIDQYLSWFQTHAPEWVQEQTVEKLIRYTGWPRVGKVQNLDVLKQISESPEFLLENVTVL
jgi:hypothetical protein